MLSIVSLNHLAYTSSNCFNYRQYMKRILPIGISNFKKLREQDFYYVDKSLLIKDLAPKGRVVLMPRPRRFGKTLNLSMLRYFYEKSATSTAYLFEDLKIWEHEEFRKEQGQYPVIYVSFKEIFQASYPEMLERFAFCIALECKKHPELFTSAKLDDDEKKWFKRLSTKSSSEFELASSLKFLTEVLYKHHQKEVILLIDEYDVPVQAAYVHGFYDKLILFLKELLTGALKDNERIEKGILTGIMTLAKAGIFTGLNNLDIYNLTHPKLADKFGFTSDEAEVLLKYYDINELKSVKEWYNGYIFGETNGMFNPWSMLKCIEMKGSLEIYWSNTSDNILLKRLISRASSTTKSELEQLLTGSSIKKAIEESVVYPNIDKQQHLIWTVLLFTGYLTYTDYKVNKGKKECDLIIPNEEIKNLYQDLITQLFAESVAGDHVQDLLVSMLEGQTEIFSSLLQDFVLTSMSTYDLASSEPESSYHLFILGLLVMLSDTYEVRSNRESGLGRYDIMISPKEKHKPAVVIEFKKVWKKTENGLEVSAQKALDQIIEKKYAQELYDQGIQNIIAYGIAFEGKSLCVKSCTLENPQLEC